MSASYLSPSAAERIEGYVQRGLATVMAIVTPARVLTIRRLSAGGVFDPVLTASFSVRINNRQAMDVAEDAIEAQQISGTIKRQLPDPIDVRLKPGDRFAISELGPATISTVYPDKFGIETAEWVLEEGAP